MHNRNFPLVNGSTTAVMLDSLHHSIESTRLQKESSCDALVVRRTLDSAHGEMREYFVRCGQKVVSLMGQHHVRYHGNAFYIQKGDYVEVPRDSRIMVDFSPYPLMLRS